MIVPLKFEDLISDHFMTVIENTKNDVMLNIFIVGYECDQGVRACGGRSGTELGPTVFRKLLQEENQQSFDDLAKQLKKHQTVIYDLGNVRKYQLSKFAKAASSTLGQPTQGHEKQGQEKKDEENKNETFIDDDLDKSGSSIGSISQNVRLSNFVDLFEFITKKVPNSKIFVMGGSDEVCLSGYRSKIFDHIIHLDSQIDVKPKFKLQLEDKDANGKLLFQP